jgi:hypothetical protein
MRDEADARPHAHRPAACACVRVVTILATLCVPREISGKPDLASSRERISRAARYSAMSIAGRARYLAISSCLYRKGARVYKSAARVAKTDADPRGDEKASLAGGS